MGESKQEQKQKRRLEKRLARRRQLKADREAAEGLAPGERSTAEGRQRDVGAGAWREVGS